MNSDEKNCPLCGEVIKLVAIKCKHCGSMIGDSSEERLSQELTKESENPRENEHIKESRKEEFEDNKTNTASDQVTQDTLSRRLLINSGYVATAVSGTLIFFVKKDLLTALVVSQILSISFLIFILTVYIKDKGSLPVKVRDEIPWYGSAIAVFFFPMLAVPLYYRHLKFRGFFVGSLGSLTWGWVLATLMGIVLILRTGLVIDKEFNSLFLPEQSQVTTKSGNLGVQKIDVSKLVGMYWLDLVDPDKRTPFSDQFINTVVRRVPLEGRVQHAFDRFHVQGEFKQYTKNSVVARRCLPGECNTSNMHIAISSNAAMAIIIQEDEDCFLYKTNDFNDWKTLIDANAICNRYVSESVIN